MVFVMEGGIRVFFRKQNDEVGDVWGLVDDEIIFICFSDFGVRLQFGYIFGVYEISLIDFRGKTRDYIKCIVKFLRYFWICFYFVIIRVVEVFEVVFIFCLQGGGCCWDVGRNSGLGCIRKIWGLILGLLFRGRVLKFKVILEIILLYFFIFCK